MEKVRYIIVGIGRMGSIHANNILKGRVKNATLVAIIDNQESAILKFKESVKTKKYKIEYFDSIEKIDKNTFDSVIIATPHYSHVEIAKYFLQMNKFVLIEKPLSVTIEEANSLKTYVENNNKQNMAAIDYNQRTNNVYIKAKEIIKSDKIGKLKSVRMIITNWYRSDAYYQNDSWRGTYVGEGGGLLINQCVHQIDILTWLLGIPVSVYALMKTVGRKITTENEVLAILDYSGSECIFYTSGHEMPGVNSIEIAGEKGYLKITPFLLKTVFFKKSEPEVNRETTSGYGAVKKKVCYYTNIKNILKDLIYGQQLRILNNFTDHILSNCECIAPVIEGVNAVSIINAIYQSAWEGRKIVFPLDEKKYTKLLELKKEKQ